jgi:pSer/pThr/pTyr-binding forkhead associated (FHA) protein
MPKEMLAAAKREQLEGTDDASEQPSVPPVVGTGLFTSDDSAREAEQAEPSVPAAAEAPAMRDTPDAFEPGDAFEPDASADVFEPDESADAFEPDESADAFEPEPADAFEPESADAFEPDEPADAFEPSEPRDAFEPAEPTESVAVFEAQDAFEPAETTNAFEPGAASAPPAAARPVGALADRVTVTEAQASNGAEVDRPKPVLAPQETAAELDQSVQSTIIELPPVMLQTVPPSIAPPPIVPPPMPVPEVVQPALPPVITLGEPVSEPTIPLQALRAAKLAPSPVQSEPPRPRKSSSRPPVGTPPPRVRAVPTDVHSTVRPDERPLPGTDRIIPAAEIALSSRPPSAVPPVEPELGVTVPAMSLGDIARALRHEAGAIEPLPEMPATISEEADFEDTLGSFDDVLDLPDPLHLSDDDEEVDGFDGSLDGFVDSDDQNPQQDDAEGDANELRDESALAGVVEALNGGKPEAARASVLAPEPEGAVTPDGEAQRAPILSEAPAELLSTDELIALQTSKAGPPPLPRVEAEFTLRLLSPDAAARVIEVGAAGVEIGQSTGDVQIDDPWCSPRHAQISLEKATLHIDDLDSLNGVWLRLRQPATLRYGDRFMIGEQIIEVRQAKRVEALEAVKNVRRLGAAHATSAFELHAVGGDGQSTQRATLPLTGTRLGRHIAEIVFTQDDQMSTTHAVVRPTGDTLRLDDLQSKNGTWVQLTERTKLEAGDTFMTGRTLWRVGRPLKAV